MEEGLKFECEFIGEDGQVKAVKLYSATESPNNQVITYTTLLSLVTPEFLDLFGDCEDGVIFLRSGQKVLESDDDVINVVSSAVKVGLKVVKVQATYPGTGNGSDWEIVSDFAGSQAAEEKKKCDCDCDCDCDCCDAKANPENETEAVTNSEDCGCGCNSGCKCECDGDCRCCHKEKDNDDDISSLVVEDEQVLETEVTTAVDCECDYSCNENEMKEKEVLETETTAEGIDAESCKCGCGCDCTCDCKCECGCNENKEDDVSKLEEGLLKLNGANDSLSMESDINKFGEALMDMVKKSKEQSKVYEFSGEPGSNVNESLEVESTDHKSMATLGCFNDGISEWTQPSFMSKDLNSQAGSGVEVKSIDVKSEEISVGNVSKSFEDVGSSSFLTAALKDIEKLLGAEDSDNEMNEKFKILLTTLSTLVSEVLTAAGVNPNNNTGDSVSDCGDTENINMNGLVCQMLKVASDRDAVQCIQRFLATSSVTDVVVDLATNEACTAEQIKSIIMNHLGDILPEVGRVFRQSPQVLVIVPQLLIWLVACMKLNHQNPNANGDNDNLNANDFSPEMVIHENIICDGCESSNEYKIAAMQNGTIQVSGQYIRGVRYKSGIVPNYDLCATCEASGDFEQDYAPFLKINTPSKAPQEIVCVLVQNDEDSFRQQQLSETAQEPHQAHQSQSTPDRHVSFLVCPTNGHPLQRFVVPNRLFACDVCDRRPAEGSTMYGCRLCDWDTCQNCAELNSPGIVHSTSNATAVPQSPNQPVTNCRGARPPAPVRILDYENPALRPRSKFVADVTIPDGSVLRPGEKFTKIWRIKNTSENGVAWPNQCRIVCVGGDMMGCNPGGVLVAPLPAGSSGDICVDLTAPSAPGRSVGYWRLITPSTSVNPGGIRFGQRLWVDLAVSDSAPFAPATAPEVPNPAASNVTGDDGFGKWGEQLQQLAEMDFLNVKVNVELLEEEGGNMTKVIERLLLD
mmetsp:Transcript_400/g.518  ORF Transcript_400/g.518 Transcript_400/m.518 type:complete len:970 (+) Transcript_400:710-3619(+)